MNNQNETITSPCNKPLHVVLFKSKEGIEQRGVQCYEGVMTFKELVDHFKAEKGSEEIGEVDKKQRDVDTKRVNGLKQYWTTSQGTVFPNITLFANSLSLKNSVTVGNKLIIEATLEKNADRFIADGQGQQAFIDWLLSDESNTEFEDHTISFKLIVTQTESLSTPKAVQIIRQLFADYHVKLTKPNSSISKHFDNSTVLSRLMNDCLELQVDSYKLKSKIALHGKIKAGHIWTFQQFTTMMQKFLNLTNSTASKQITDEAQYEGALNLCRSYLTCIFKLLPIENITSTQDHEKAMFTRAIFANALGYVGRSLMDEMLLDNSITWERINLKGIPIEDKSDSFWLEANVTMKDKGTIKIIKSTDTRIGSLICRKLRIYPCPELSA
ncbi:MAG: DGQHR domain-containing protein [Pseudoalteromonas sp.]|uniref:DGQHR domain-containing protein n=1 Tax=Pseudoalteromonas sp. TaxID=53249 RepID=UPI001D415BD6|nr:DGQHR domain-containing protein [Pseudoalteromonas sp.]NRA79464.1 DGQHR domain-containing protein [Pseudoalteromonas sp.]